MSSDAFGVMARRAALTLAILVCVGLAGACLWLQRDLAAKEAEARRLSEEAEAGAERMKLLRQELAEIRELVIEANEAPHPQQHEATVLQEGNQQLHEARDAERVDAEGRDAAPGR